MSHLPRAQSQSTTTGTCKVHLACTESQKKHTAAKAAETQARNKATKAAQSSKGLGAVRPNNASESTTNPPPTQTPQVRPETTFLGTIDSRFGAYSISLSNTHICSNIIIQRVDLIPIYIGM